MIILKSPEEIEKMAAASRIVANILVRLGEALAPGITTDDLDRISHEMILKSGAIPTFVGYRGYPKSLCTSINEAVVHGIPGSRALREGDIIGIDLGVTYQGFVGDSAVTLPVGKVSDEAARLMRVTKECLIKGIECVREGSRIGDIGNVVSTHAEAHGYSVVKDFVGHGIGRQMHEEPQVPNYGKPGTGPRIKAGLVVAIEPMINAGTSAVEVLADNWTVVTVDKRLSAHFEHTVACTPNGPRILTLPG